MVSRGPDTWTSSTDFPDVLAENYKWEQNSLDCNISAIIWDVVIADSRLAHCATD